MANAASEHQVWPLWRAYKRLFRTWMLPISTWTTPGAWGWLGNDVVSGLRANPSTRKAVALLQDVAAPEFDTLSALATLNLRRQEQGFQVLVLFYISVPLTLILAVGEFAPEAGLAFMRQERDVLLQLGVALVGATLFYLAALWRARQMVHVLDLIRIERDQRPFTAVELRET